MQNDTIPLSITYAGPLFMQMIFNLQDTFDKLTGHFIATITQLRSQNSQYMMRNNYSFQRNVRTNWIENSCSFNRIKNLFQANKRPRGKIELIQLKSFVIKFFFSLCVECLIF